MSIEHQETTTDGGDNHLANVNAIDVLRVDGKIFAVTGGTDNRLDVYEIDNDPASPTYGQMSSTPVDTVVDTASLNLNNIKAIESLEIDGTTYVFAGGSESGVSSFAVDNTGQLTPVDNATNTGPINLEDVRDLSTVSLDDGAGGTNHFLFTVADGAGANSIDNDGISVFQVASDGTMTNVDNVIDDGTLQINNPQDIEAVQVDDGAGGVSTFVIAGGNEDGVSVFSVAGDGTLTNTDNVTDDATLQLQNVRSIEGFEIGGTSYVVVGSDGEGLSFFEIDNAGTLTNVGNVADDATLNLNAIDDVYVGEYQGVQALWVAGRDDGLDVFEISVTAGTGEIVLTRIANFDETSFDTSDMRALDGDSGFIVAGDTASSSISSFTAPCFAPDTLILTVDGELPVEELAIGDLIMTADHGARPLRWIGRRRVAFGTPETNRQKPIEIKAGALGSGLPRRTLVVSPQHRMVLPGPNGTEALCLAKGLTGLANVRRMAGKRATTYYALLLDQHEVIYAEGAATESFFPGEFILSQLPETQRAEVLSIVSGSATPGAGAPYAPARAVLTRQEVEALVSAHRNSVADAAA